tara:strand:- start:232 stop:1266 length:1035 start_codon:yes stop_codon:yes gene_type:complete
MQEEITFAPAIEIMRQRTGVVIPVYFPQGVDNELGRALLEDNVQAYVTQVDDPQVICLSVDGAEYGKDVAAAIAARHGVQAVCAPHNKGKLHALRNGVAHLCEQAEFDYIAAVDSDGDHFANELLNLVRAAHYATHHMGAADVLVLGRRISRHRPMGWLRGELEELADRVLLDALAYHAAVNNAPLRLECATTLEEFPDFHSGFKLYSRAVAQAVFLQAPQLCGVEETAYYRHGCEAVMSVEALLGGAYLVLVNRTTLNEQPISTFGLLERTRMVADKMVWPCKRLGVPGSFIDQWLRNHMPRLLLPTLTPQGKDELLEIRRLVLREFGIEAGDDDVQWGPLFV